MFVKKNGTINLSEISRQTSRGINAIKREINRFKSIEDYNQYEEQKDYNKKRKKSIKKLPTFTEDQLDFFKIRFNKYRDTPEKLIYRYFLGFSVKFPARVKTLYKWINLGEFVLKKENLPHRGKKYKTKRNRDNRGKLTNFKSIWNIENKVSNVGWFEMNTVFGKDHQSSNLVLVEQSNKNYFVMKLKKIILLMKF